MIKQDANDTDGVGEICIKSPSLFKEYWNLPEVTKESFTEDGYFKTGDSGRVDEDGYYVILGRKHIQKTLVYDWFCVPFLDILSSTGFDQATVLTL